MTIEIQVIDVQDVLVVDVGGQVNSVTAIKLGEQLERASRRGDYKVVLDLEDVGYLTSAGLREILSGVERAKAGGGDLRLANPSTTVLEVLEMTALDKVLSIYATRDEAVQSFA